MSWPVLFIVWRMITQLLPSPPWHPPWYFCALWPQTPRNSHRRKDGFSASESISTSWCILVLHEFQSLQQGRHSWVLTLWLWNHMTSLFTPRWNSKQRSRPGAMPNLKSSASSDLLLLARPLILKVTWPSKILMITENKHLEHKPVRATSDLKHSTH